MSPAVLYKKIKNNITVACLLLISAALVFIFAIYISDLKDTLNKEVENYLIENSNHIIQLVNVSFDSIEKDGNTIKRQIETMYDVEDISSYLSYLQETAEDRGFLRICIADANGNYHASDGFGTHLSDRKIYDKIMSGERHFINSEFDVETNRASIIYGIPLEKNGEVKAAMFISNDDLHFSDSIHDEGYDKQQFSVILDNTGNFVFKSTQAEELKGDAENFFEIQVATTDQQTTMDQMRSNMLEGKSGFIEYTPLDKDTELITNYHPLGNEGWYILTTIPSNVVKGSVDVFIRYSLMIVFMILCLFLLVMFMVLHNQKKSRKELEDVAYRDPITNGINDNCFRKDALKYIHEKPANYYCMVSMDVKNFKVVNATFGSRMGNRILEYIYQYFQKELADDELIARVHADVFQLLLRYTNKEEVAKRLKDIVNGLNKFNHAQQQKYYLYFQSGIYIIDIPDTSMIIIQDYANVARKHAKECMSTDLHTCHFYSDQERNVLLWEKDIENRMEEALANDEFIIYLHPKYNVKNDSIAGAEALIRWNDPVHGLLLPKDFLPVFERNSFILKIDLYAFEKVCQTLHRWYQRKEKMVQISVNISKQHLHNPNFLEDYIQIYKKYQFPAKYLRFEVTESLLCDNLALLKQVLIQMHELGFTISMDDFGSGYSSLNLLKDIDVDELKLDREFFMNETIDEKSSNIIESIISLARKLHMETVCEGVQTEAQKQFLASIHCDMIQSFMTYKPIPVEEFENLIHT